MEDKHVGIRILRQFIITAGFFPGLWFYIGYDPEAQIAYAFIDVIAKYISETFVVSQAGISFWGKTFYTLTGIISTIFTLVFAYLTGGWWGILLLVMAFIGGLTVSYDISIFGYTIPCIGFWLFVIAWLIVPWVRVNEDVA